MTSSTASVTNIDPIVEDAGISVQVADRSTSQYLTKRQFTLLTIYRVNDYEDRCRYLDFLRVLGNLGAEQLPPPRARRKVLIIVNNHAP
jgi:hypothetical protein